MISKLSNFLVTLAVVYLIAAFSYRMAVQSSVKTKLEPVHGPDVVVEKLSFNDWYLMGEKRVGTAEITYKSEKNSLTERGLNISSARIAVNVTGRFWPDVVHPSNPVPIR